MSIPKLSAFKTFQQKYSDAFTVGGLRDWIFNEEKTDLKKVARLSESVKNF